MCASAAASSIHVAHLMEQHIYLIKYTWNGNGDGTTNETNGEIKN